MGLLSDFCFGIPIYSKLEEKRNGLDVYKIADNNAIYEHYDVYKNCYDIITFYCPICDKLVKEKEITDAFEKMRNKGARRLKVLTKKYIDLISNLEEFDIFDSLEKIYLEIEDIKNNYDENRNFKHFCSHKNKNCYIIFLKEPKNEIERLANLPIPDNDGYHYLNWKNDENLKKKLLDERKNDCKAYEEEKKQKHIDDQIEGKRQELIREWDKITSAKEYKQILICYETFKNKIPFLSTHFDMGDSTEIFNIFHECCGGLEYSGSLKKLAELMSNHGKNEFHRKDAYRMILRFICMNKDEEKQFNAFANPKIEAFKKTLGV